jgi:Fur family ferric uptake transcriptional regulator
MVGSDDVQALRRRHAVLLRQLGARVTFVRLAVLEALATRGAPAAFDEIVCGTNAQYPHSDPASVYRTLETLGELGLVARLDLGTRAAHFVLLEGAMRHYLICTRCGAIATVDDAQVAAVRDHLASTMGFRSVARPLAFFGLCQDCAPAAIPAAAVPIVPE